MSKKVAAMETIADRPRMTLPSTRILDSISDKHPEQIGGYAGWGSGEDLSTAPDPEERMGPAMMPFLRHRSSDRWWKLGLWWVWLPAIVVLITVEDWLHLSQSVMWISLGVLFVAFLSFVFLVDRRPS